MVWGLLATGVCQEGVRAGETREDWESCRGSTRQAPRDSRAELPEAALPGEARLLPTALSGLKRLEWCWCLNLRLI